MEKEELDFLSPPNVSLYKLIYESPYSHLYLNHHRKNDLFIKCDQCQIPFCSPSCQLSSSLYHPLLCFNFNNNKNNNNNNNNNNDNNNISEHPLVKIYSICRYIFYLFIIIIIINL